MVVVSPARTAWAGGSLSGGGGDVGVFVRCALGFCGTFLRWMFVAHRGGVWARVRGRFDDVSELGLA